MQGPQDRGSEQGWVTLRVIGDGLELRQAKLFCAPTAT